MSPADKPPAVVGTLFVRNLGVFIRNRTAVLLAGLTPVVLGVIFVAFLRDQTVTLIEDLAPGFQAHAACDAWLFASGAVLSGFSSTVSVLLGFFDDYRAGRMGLHLASGVKRWQLVCSHLLAAVSVSFVISAIIIGLGQVWALIDGQPTMSSLLFLRALVGVFLAAIFFAGFNAAVMTFTLSQGSFGTYCLIMGITTGFLTFSFSLQRGTGVFQIAGILPFAQLGALVRNPMVTPGLGMTQGELRESLLDLLGATIQLGGGDSWPTIAIILALLSWTVLSIILSYFFMYQLLRER